MSMFCVGFVFNVLFSLFVLICCICFTFVVAGLRKKLKHIKKQKNTDETSLRNKTRRKLICNDIEIAFERDEKLA